METLMIEPSKSTPKIHFDPSTGKLLISGHAYPENAFKFFEPILQWLDLFLAENSAQFTVDFELRLPYMNTSSTKCFMILLEKLDDAYRGGMQVTVRWYYNPDNERELECAEEFKEDLQLPFELIPVEES
ncbi:DUF1987 domain-containing protein [Paenibacillus cymbidii]|uniref:DUF1987 domain-containing protein n=1 Tax=Paenibacillus cymbidii TaxID=1639034 RepID=UPI0010800E6A|nr:DUF1987 domain-containing protein [Paenibacillus cymbidii]